MPNVPTFNEAGLKGVDASSYWGALAPARTPADIINRFGTTMAQVIRMPDISRKLIDLGFEPIGGTPEQFASVIASETEKWARVIKAAGVKLD